MFGQVMESSGAELKPVLFQKEKAVSSTPGAPYEILLLKRTEELESCANLLVFLGCFSVGH